ncbi:MAG: hypothetical protein R3A47_09740 [Polyangiales bacterium]
MAQHDIIIKTDFDPSDPSDGSKKDDRAGAPIDFARVRRILWQARYWIGGAIALGLLVGFLFAKLFVKNPYNTTALLQYEGPPDVPGMPPPDPDALATAAEAFGVQPVLVKIKERSGFKGDLSTLRRQIAFTTDLQSNAVHLEVTGDSAEGVAEFSKIVVESFLEFHEEQLANRIGTEIGKLEKRRVAALKEAETARSAYQKFRQEHGIIDAGKETEGSLDSAAKLTAQSELAGTDIKALEARVSTLREQLQRTPKNMVVSTSTSPEVLQYNQLRGELANARTTLSPEHPRVQALQQQVLMLESQIKSGQLSKTGAANVGANPLYQMLSEQLQQAEGNLSALKEQQKGLSELATKAQTNVEKLSAVEGDAAALLSKVKIADQLVADLQTGISQLRDALEQPSSGFQVIDVGSKPEYAQRSKKKYMVLLAFPMIFVAGVIGFFGWKELRGFRIRTPAELSFWGKGPVIASTAWPRVDQGLDELIADLDDYAPEAKGRMLIVGATENDADFAREVAERLNDDWKPDPESIATALSSQHPARPSSRAPGGPLQTPPPMKPYTLRPSSNAPGSNALVTVRQASALSAVLPKVEERMIAEAWTGAPNGQALRRAARLADRVVVLVHSGTISSIELAKFPSRLGRNDGVGYILVGLEADLLNLPDRVGDVEKFWKARATQDSVA